MLLQKTSVINAEVFFLQEDTGKMKVIFICLPCLLLQACSEEETPLEKFLKSETPSFYAEVTGEVAVTELGKEIRLVQGENVSIVSSHTIANPGISMDAFTSWRYFLGTDDASIVIVSPVFEYNNELSIVETFSPGQKIFDGSSLGYRIANYRNHTPQFSAEDSNGDIKNGKVEVLKYHLEPVTGLPYIGLYRYLAHVWLTIECDLYDSNGVKVGRLTNGRALCIFPIG